jgi:hypothetical protein
MPSKYLYKAKVTRMFFPLELRWFLHALCLALLELVILK